MIRAELERRPLLVVCLGLIVGLTLVRHPINLLFLLAAPWILSTLTARSLVVGGMVAGCLLGPGTPPPLLKTNEFLDSEWSVATLPKITPFGQRCEIEHGDIRMLMTYGGHLQLCPGSLLHIKAVAKPPNEGMDEYFTAKSLSGRVFADADALKILAEGPWIQRVGCAWRNEFLGLTNRNLPAPAAAVVSSICFNADGFLDPSSREEMQRTGTTHIIAASGLQVLIVSQSLLLLLGLLPIPRVAQLGLVALILCLYAIATGLHPAVVRAVLMSLLANSAYLVRCEPDWASALGAVGILFLIWKPGTVYEVGFQFSFFAVFFLSLFPDRTKWRPGLEAWAYRTARRSIRTAAIAFCIVLPLTAYQFGLVSWLAIPANLLVLIAAAPIVIVSMAALLIDGVLPSVANGLMRCTQPLASYIDSVLHALGGTGAATTVPPFDAYWLVLFYGLMLLLWRPFVRQP